MTAYAADLAAVRRAAKRVRPFVHRTPVLTCVTLDRIAGRKLYFKCENLQKTGSFKYRGATNAVQSLPDDVAARGVVTHSSGNHAQALALAARVRGVTATVVMPHTAPKVKKAGVIGYGGQVVECEPTERVATADAVVRRTGGVLIPPFEHPDVIAGQGTAVLELLEECPDLDAVVVPVGGGGHVSGVAVAGRGLRAGLRVFGAEPALADDAARSKATGVRQPALPPTSIADGLLTGLGELTWPVVRDQVEAVFTVTEAEIVAAMRLLWERAKLVVEPSGAVGLAAVLGEAFRPLDGVERVGVILSGGNVDLDRRYW